jgi:hypothetical protein
MYQFISIAALVSYFIPLLIVLVKKLWDDKFFVLFAAYWTLGGVINATDFIPAIPRNINVGIGIFYNLVDIPFILAILYYTTNSIIVRKFASFAIILSILSEVFGLLINGFNYEALRYSLGIGVALVLIIVIWEIIRYLQKIEHSNRQNAKVFIYAAVLFEYAPFILIYIFDYFVDVTNTKDSYLNYYISSVVALFIASCGYLLFKKYERNQNQVSY